MKKVFLIAIIITAVIFLNTIDVYANASIGHSKDVEIDGVIKWKMGEGIEQESETSGELRKTMSTPMMPSNTIPVANKGSSDPSLVSTFTNTTIMIYTANQAMPSTNLPQHLKDMILNLHELCNDLLSTHVPYMPAKSSRSYYLTGNYLNDELLNETFAEKYNLSIFNLWLSLF